MKPKIMSSETKEEISYDFRVTMKALVVNDLQLLEVNFGIKKNMLHAVPLSTILRTRGHINMIRNEKSWMMDEHYCK